ncbi:tetratricopeptide repeat protein [Gilvimarinus agarilyticus]|uniref:tetratricopeptide repeat protein n=1 Tax=unclassified Gilvimarinus TaxID=2642066 RepID=UPI001C0A3FE9|nr:MULTISPECIES: tetratricopeptide repeat protein [unclassified Gilvimarinus]MBU2886595.1 tetratricopeptide repeat protein [Gilvimarinus agarilyticus]MDO6571263.1 tetratricopeptide repeat protein [Gilvimarinus sp. 2_MG-2023]MDO6746362.1 tetratricopeptide repeat protein [Gilvimarinus sp. 1_MG-2023]
MKKLKSVITNTLRKSVAVSVVAAAPFALLSAADVSALDVAPAGAKALQPAEKRPDPRRLPGLPQSFLEDYSEVTSTLEPNDEQIADGAKPNPAKAFEMAKEMEEDADDLNPYAKAMLFQVLGQIYYEREDTANTIRYFEKVVGQSPNLPVGTEAQFYYFLGQLYAQEENEQKAVEYLEKWSKMVAMISPSQYATLAQIYYGADQPEKALANMLHAVQVYEAEGKVPREDWLSFLRALYYFKEDFQSTLSIVKTLVRHYPKMNYWTQLSSLYYELGQMENFSRAQDSMYVMGGLKKENELKGLAGYFIENEAPYKAAKVLDKAINNDKLVDPTSANLELLANSWRLAQETDKALVEMKRAAAKSDDGDLYFNLARLLFSRDEFSAASSAAKNALSKGGLKRPDQVHMTIGQTELELGNFEEAIEAFTKASRDKRSRQFANQWIKFTEGERKRQEALKEG